MRKIIFIIGMIISVILAGITTVNAVTATTELKASNTNLKPGDTFTVTLSLTTDRAVESIGGDQLGVSENDFFAIIYDQNKLEVVSQEVVSTGVMDSGIDVDDETGKVYGRATNNVELWGASISSGDLYKWTFKVKDNATQGSTEISTSKLILTDFSDEETEVQTKPVTVTIGSSSSDSGQGNNDGENSGGNSDGNNEGNNSGTSGNQGSTTGNGENTSGQGNTNTRGSSSGKSTAGGTTKAGKATDSTTAASAGKVIPNAGLTVMGAIAFVGAATIGINAYKKYNQLRDIR